jgi:hypothetical protein
LQLLAQRVILHRGQRDQVLNRREGHVERIAVQRALGNVSDNKAPVAHLDDLALLGWCDRRHQRTSWNSSW